MMRDLDKLEFLVICNGRTGVHDRIRALRAEGMTYAAAIDRMYRAQLLYNAVLVPTS